MAAHAQLVGMTIASECVAACDLGLAYAAICVVENLANGVGERELTMEELLAGRAANREAVARGARAVWCRRWHEPGGDRRPARRRGRSACGSRRAGSSRWGRGWSPGRATR